MPSPQAKPDSRGLDPRIGFRGWLIAGSNPAMTQF
jgi:hypothetical protein